MQTRTERKSEERRVRRQLARISASLMVRSGLYSIVDEARQTIVANQLTLAEVQQWTADAVQVARNSINAPKFEPRVDIHQGDALTVLRRMKAESVQCCVSSPPYFQHRDYGVRGQIGQERTPDRYVKRLVGIMEAVRRVLKRDGTAWLVLGDGYNSNPSTSSTPRSQQGNGSGAFRIPAEHHHAARRGQPNRATPLISAGIKKKDLLGIPWMVAFALRDAGWYWRSSIIWQKPAPMPESATDRPTQSYEVVLLLSRSERYLYNSMREPSGSTWNSARKFNAQGQQARQGLPRKTYGKDVEQNGRNVRNVWRIPVARLPRRFAGAHFAVMPTELARRCILMGSNEGDSIIDPFGGSGTTALAALQLNRHSTMIEINPAYVELIRARLAEALPPGDA